MDVKVPALASDEARRCDERFVEGGLVSEVLPPASDAGVDEIDVAAAVVPVLEVEAMALLGSDDDDDEEL